MIKFGIVSFIQKQLSTNKPCKHFCLEELSNKNIVQINMTYSTLLYRIQISAQLVFICADNFHLQIWIILFG